jgi:hypothetical protein
MNQRAMGHTPLDTCLNGIQFELNGIQVELRRKTSGQAREDELRRERVAGPWTREGDAVRVSGHTGTL